MSVMFCSVPCVGGYLRWLYLRMDSVLGMAFGDVVWPSSLVKERFGNGVFIQTDGWLHSFHLWFSFLVLISDFLES